MASDQTKLDLANDLQKQLGDKIGHLELKDMVTLEISAQHWLSVAQVLRDQESFCFEQLVDICGIDYIEYGISSWRTEETTTSGFSRGVVFSDLDKSRDLDKPCDLDKQKRWQKPRFGVIYHLLSLTHNHRLRVRVLLEEEPMIPSVPSVIDVWVSASWFEREVYDLFGIIFEGHPDLRRILTDYGFTGHPFRKDFPLIGEVEMRYDATLERCVYEPVSIQPRVLVPKVIRDDNRYLHTELPPKGSGAPEAEGGQ